MTEQAAWEQHVLDNSQHLRKNILDLALKAHDCAIKSGMIVDKHFITVIDYSLPSSKRRLWVIDVDHQSVPYYLRVAHGRNSGLLWSRHFSDRPGSKASSLGLFLTTRTYSGKHGYTLRLSGLESGFNRHARQRLVVIHGADYATPSFLHRYGRLGRSWGCPAVDPHVARPLIDTIKRGSLVFAYYPDKKWLKGSKYLHCR